METIGGDVQRMRSVDQPCVPGFGIAPSIRYGFIWNIVVQAATAQPAVYGALERARRKELKNLDGSRIGGVQWRVLEGCGGHADPAAEGCKPRCRKDTDCCRCM